ncbi:MAG: HEAT repeat domain-containing protein [Polyangiaceae bacterium]
MALGVSGDERALPTLLQLLERGDRDVHLSALEGLGKLGSKAAIPVLTALLLVGSRAEFDAAATALAEIEPELALQSLIAATHGDNAKRRALAVSALASLSPSAGRKRALFDLARSSELSLAVEAVRALGADHDVEAEPLLLEAARSESFELRHAAASALARFDSPTAAAQLRAMLQDDVHEVAENALGILGSRPGVGEAERRRALAAGEVKLTSHAVRLLTLDESPEAQSVLLDYLASSPVEPTELRMVLAQAQPATLDVLVQKYATDADDALRFSVMSALSERAEPRFESTLRAALRDENDQTRRLAVSGLISMGSNDANALLDGLLTSSELEDKKLGYDSVVGARRRGVARAFASIARKRRRQR